jgi:Tropinone reductase 1|eukprot:scaffold253_cov267-Chaetoceros_neogracile.AAC.30
MNQQGIEKRWSLENKYVLVTGGSRGIGNGVVKATLQHNPAKIIICSYSLKELNKAISSINDPRVTGIECDISTEEGRNRLVTFVCDNLPRLDILVNNVGINVRKPITEQTDEEYFRIMRTNVDSTYFLCKHLLPLLKEAEGGASIVNVASAAGVQSSGTGAAYGMSKAAIIHYSKILACEWAQYKIRVNCVAPWMCMTPMLLDALKGDESQLDKVYDWTPMGRIADIQEIVDPIMFLMMDASSFITGQCLGVDGGLTAQGFQGSCVE